ncbi:MAG: CHASE2 domain-containing protein [Candidatus Latescibacterota bacterium]|nr:MAG: CHASE2 domain-containing protein [Candidatus Latescibacterota bacterium]
MNHPLQLAFCFIFSGLLSALALIPWGVLEVFEFKTVDVRMWVRELFREPEPRDAVETFLVDDAALTAAMRGGEGASQLHRALSRISREATAPNTLLGVQLPTWHTVATPLLRDVLTPWLDARDPADDAEAAALPRVVVGVPFGADVTGGDARFPRLDLAPLPESAWVDASGRREPTAPAARALPTAGMQRQPPPLRIGEIDLGGDHDGVVRRVALVFMRNGRLYPSFVLQLVCAHDRAPLHDTRVRFGDALEIRRGQEVVRRIPIDERGRMIVNYRERPAEARVPLRPLPGGAEAGVQRKRARDSGAAPRILLLGTSARWVGNLHNIPVGGRVGEVEIAAEALQTILTDHYLRRVRRSEQFLLTWVILFAGSLAMVRLPSWRGIAFGFGLVVLYYGLESVAFVWGDVWFGVVLPIIALTWGAAVFPVYGFRWRTKRLVDEMRLLRRFDDLVLMNIAGGLIVAGRHGMVVRHNPRAAELLGVPGQSLHGRHVRELFAISPAMLELLGQVMGHSTTQDASVSLKLPMATRVSVPAEAHQQERVLELEVALVDPELLKSPRLEDLPCYVLTFDDVTEQVQRAHEDARRARLAAVGEIAAKLGHEIRNSLGGLRLYVENVREEVPPHGTGARSIEAMVREIQSLYRKIDELRQYGADPQLEFSRCSLKELLEEALAYASRKLSEKHIRVVLECDRNMPNVLVDRRQLREAFQNLINNAIEAAPEGGRVSIQVERTTTGNGATSPAYRIHFEDNGPGIAPDLQEHVFSLFFTTKPEIGTGLGLPTVKKIVESHGGHIQFACGDEGGTTFTITLPAARDSEEVQT